MTLQKKYLPQSWNEILGQDKIVNILSGYKDVSSLPHLIFIGQSGVGKTASAYVLAKSLNTSIIELNASDERGIDVVREKIKTLLFTSGQRIILLDEADSLCLHYDTKIMVNGWEQKIEEVVDKTFTTVSYDFQKKEAIKSNAKCIDSGINFLYKVFFDNGREIICSGNQPFFTRTGTLKTLKVKKLKELKLEEEIIMFDENIKTSKLSGIKEFGQEQAYDLVVPKYHNYITANGILTHNTTDAQAALRRPMEQALQRTNNRLILTINRPWKIIDAISSRCTNLHFQPLSKEALTKISYRVLKREGMKFKNKEEIKQIINALVSYSRGDARKLLDVIDNYSHSKESLIQYIQKKDAEVNQIREIFQASANADWEKCLLLTESWIIQNPSLSGSEIIEELYKEVKNLDMISLKKFQLYVKLGDIERNLKLQCSPLIQLSSFFMSVIGIQYGLKNE